MHKQPDYWFRTFRSKTTTYKQSFKMLNVGLESYVSPCQHCKINGCPISINFIWFSITVKPTVRNILELLNIVNIFPLYVRFLNVPRKIFKRPNLPYSFQYMLKTKQRCQKFFSLNFRENWRAHPVYTQAGKATGPSPAAPKPTGARSLHYRKQMRNFLSEHAFHQTLLYSKGNILRCLTETSEA